MDKRIEHYIRIGHAHVRVTETHHAAYKACFATSGHFPHHVLQQDPTGVWELLNMN